MTRGDTEKRGLGWLIASLVIGLGVTALVLYVLRAPPETAGAVGSATRLFRAPIAGAPSKGPADALVTIVEFSDFQCPHCRAAAQTIGRLVDEADDVRLVFRHAPLTQIHRYAADAAVASLAAHEQGRFWEYHDALFANQAALERRGPALFGDLARRLGLDEVRFQQALDGPRLLRKVRADRRLLLQLGQGAVPTFFVNGRVMRGNVPEEDMREVIDDARARARETLARGVPRAGLYRALVADGVGPPLAEPAGGPPPAASPAPDLLDLSTAPTCRPGAEAQPECASPAEGDGGDGAVSAD